MPYRCEAQSVQGFIQQLAAVYVAKGSWFHITGHVSEKKVAAQVDAKLIERYGIDLSHWARARTKRAGHASVQYRGRCEPFE
jgi:hypothetical protein